MAENVDKWSNDFENHIKNPPKPGTILRAYGNADARLDIELVQGKAPFVYGRAYVPCIVGHALGWYLQATDSDAAHGWKCILLPKAREECLRKMGLKKLTIAVKALRVVRSSQTGNSLLCEVAEYCQPAPPAPPAAEPASEPIPEAVPFDVEINL